MYIYDCVFYPNRTNRTIMEHYYPIDGMINHLPLYAILRMIYDMKKCSVMTGLLLGILMLNSSCNNQKPEQKSATNVRLLTVKNASAMCAQDFPGRVVPAQEVNLAFKVSGTLLRVIPEEGSRVVKGQLVAEMDSRDYQVQLHAAEAEYLSVKSEAERVMALYADSVGTADANDKARYGLQQISAKYENAQNQLKDTKLYAPFNGYVQKRLFDPPTVVAAGMPVMTIVSEGRQEIEINIPASTYLQREAIVSFSTSFDFLSDTSVSLSLVSISPKANANQLYTVRLALPDGLSPQPAPGMNTMVSVSFGDTASNRIEVPSSALFRKNGKTCVWVYDAKESKIGKRVVSVEKLDLDGHAIVTKGLSAGEQIVVGGVNKLSDRQSVKPVATESKTNVGGLL